MYKTIVKANAVLVVQHAAGALIPILLIPHIARNIGLSAFGAFAIAMASSAYAVALIQYAFHLTGPAMYPLAESAAEKCNLFWSVFLAKLLLFLSLALLAVPLALLFSELQGRDYLWTLLALPAIAALFNSSWFMQSAGRFTSVATVSIVGSVVSLAVGFLLVKGDSENALRWAALSIVLAPLVLGIGSFSLAVQEARAPGAAGELIDLPRAAAHLAAGGPLFFSQFTSLCYVGAGPILVGLISTGEAAGAYTVVEKFVGALASAALLVHTAAYPSLSAAFARDRAAYKRLVIFVLSVYLLSAALLAAVAVAFQDRVLAYLMGPKGAAQQSLLLWGLAYLLLSIFGPLVTGYWTLANKAVNVWKLTVAVLVMSLLIGVPAIAYFGGSGWMMALVLSQLAVVVTAGVAFHREFASVLVRTGE